MSTLPWVLVIAMVVVAAVFLGWRGLSRVRALPCPPWLMWLLENPFAMRRTFTPVLERLALRPGLQVLDIGCGYGRLAIPIARLVAPGGAVVGLDIQEGMLRIARERAKSGGLTNISFTRAGAGEGAIDSGRFDRALMVTVLGEIPRQAEALREVRRALKPDGFLSITEFLPDPHFQRVGHARRLAAEAGFRETAFFGNAVGYTLNLQPG